MNLQCSECNNKELKFQTYQFQLTEKQPRSAFGLTCTQCGHIEEVIRVTAPPKQQSSGNIKKNIDVVDYNTLKGSYDLLIRSLSELNIKAQTQNATGDIKFLPIDPNKPTGIVASNAQQQDQSKTEHPPAGTASPGGDL